MQKYIKNNFANNRICYLIIDVNAFVLFIFKLNDEFRLCVDYKNFNAITLKKNFFYFLSKKRSIILLTQNISRNSILKMFITKFELKQKTNEKLFFERDMNFLNTL